MLPNTKPTLVFLWFAAVAAASKWKDDWAASCVRLHWSGPHLWICPSLCGADNNSLQKKCEHAKTKIRRWLLAKYASIQIFSRMYPSFQWCYTTEVMRHLNSNLEDLIARGQHSKILILDGSHGRKDGADSLTLYQRSFMEETCEILGTRHHVRRRQSMFPTYEKIRPCSEWLLRDWRRKWWFCDKINLYQALRKKTLWE